jgi:hypothetical protein
VSDGLDEEDVPLSTRGNRNTTDITKPWVLKDKDRYEYFIPAVLCFVFKSIGNVNLPEMHCSVLFTMVMRFDCSELSQDQRDYVIENIRFRIDEREIESKDSMKAVWRGTTLFCTYRSNDEEFYFHPDLSRLPFDKPILDLKFDLTSIENKKTNETFRFNCLLVKELLGNSGIVTVKEKCDRIPEYNLALSDIEISRPMEAKVDPKTHKWLYVYYPTTIVHIPLYREPENLIFSVVMPLWVLNLFTLSVFLLEGSDFATKLSILVTIILAVFAFTFVVRSILPQVPYITDLENQILISLLVLFVSGIGSVAEYLTADESMLLTKYISGGISGAVVVISFLVFIFQYFFYKRECNKNDRMNDEYYHAQRAKVQAQSTFDFQNCVGPGLVYPPKPVQHHLPGHHD